MKCAIQSYLELYVLVAEMTLTGQKPWLELTAPVQARVAFMRFGLGPKFTVAQELSSTDGAALDACLREIANPKALLIPDAEVKTYCTDTRSDVVLDYANCCRFGVDFKPPGATGFLPQPLNIVQAERAARYAKALEPSVGFAERLVHFWANHFSIYYGKGNMVSATVGHLERAVIRPRVFGRFVDMLKGVYTHPAMICYLENQSSIGPNSPFGSKNKKSCNENLAREILELHTLGVYGGYTQADVTSFAKVITGWTHYPAYIRASGTNSPHPQAGQFYFEPSYHEPGPQTVLGVTYKQSGIDQGMAVLDSLAAHPSTAQHIAYKLIKHFITDDPPSWAVNSLSREFRRSGGDLARVSKALLNLPIAWSAPFDRLIQPVQWQASMMRGLGVSKETLLKREVNNGVLTYVNEGGLTYWTASISQFPWARLTPDGYPDDNYYWMNPDSVRVRKDVARYIVNIGRVNGAFPTPPGTASAALLPGVRSKALADAIAAEKDPIYGYVMLFASPEYLFR